MQELQRDLGRAVFAAAPVAMFVADVAGRIVKVNHELVRLTQWRREMLIGRTATELVPGEGVCRRRDGSLFPAEIHRSVLVDPGVTVFSVYDLTERRRTEQELFHRATHDPLTGLANRSLLRDRLALAAERLARRRGWIAVLFVDLDHFKQINDTQGHDVGDATLGAAAEALVEAVRPADTVARVGGDEFVVVCEDIAGEGAARDVAERIRRGVADAVCSVAGSEPAVTASVGLVVAEGAVATDELIDAADEAMYAAKRAGGDRVAAVALGLRTARRD